MDPKFAGESICVPGWTDIDQMPDTPTLANHHRRAQSETFFRYPGFDDLPLDDVVFDMGLDLGPSPPTLLPNGPAVLQPAQGSKAQETRPPAHLRSLSMNTDFFEGVGPDFLPSPITEAGPHTGPSHLRSSSFDGCSSGTSCEVDSGKRAMGAEKLADELSLVDPKKVKRILANRQSAVRSKEKKRKYTHELEMKVQTLQTEATKLSAQFLQKGRDNIDLTNENKELKLKLDAAEREVHRRQELNQKFVWEVQRLIGEMLAMNGYNGGSVSQYSSQPPINYNQQHQATQNQQMQQNYYQNHHATSNNVRLNGGFQGFQS